MKVAKKISKLLSQGDITENYIHGDQNWDLQKIHGFFTCVLPSHYLNHPKPWKSMSGKLDFAVDLNRTSTQKINNKNIIALSGDLTENTLADYLFRSEILLSLLTKDLTKCAIRLKGSGISPDQMESILKVNKMLQKERKKATKEKTVLSKKTKRELLSLCQSEGF